MEDDWDLIQEHVDNIYSTHNELFGFSDLSEKVYSQQAFLFKIFNCCISTSRNSFVSNKTIHYIKTGRRITDSRRLDSFTDSYELGVNMIKGDHLTPFLAVVCLIWMIHYTKYITGLSLDSDRAEGSIYIKLGCKTCSRTPASSLHGIQKDLHFKRYVFQ